MNRLNLPESVEISGDMALAAYKSLLTVIRQMEGWQVDNPKRDYTESIKVYRGYVEELERLLKWNESEG